LRKIRGGEIKAPAAGRSAAGAIRKADREEEKGRPSYIQGLGGGKSPEIS